MSNTLTALAIREYHATATACHFAHALPFGKTRCDQPAYAIVRKADWPEGHGIAACQDAADDLGVRGWQVYNLDTLRQFAANHATTTTHGEACAECAREVASARTMAQATGSPGSTSITQNTDGTEHRATYRRVPVIGTDGVTRRMDKADALTALGELLMDGTPDPDDTDDCGIAPWEAN